MKYILRNTEEKCIGYKVCIKFDSNPSSHQISSIGIIGILLVYDQIPAKLMTFPWASALLCVVLNRNYYSSMITLRWWTLSTLRSHYTLLKVVVGWLNSFSPPSPFCRIMGGCVKTQNELTFTPLWWGKKGALFFILGTIISVTFPVNTAAP